MAQQRDEIRYQIKGHYGISNRRGQAPFGQPRRAGVCGNGAIHVKLFSKTGRDGFDAAHSLCIHKGRGGYVSLTRFGFVSTAARICFKRAMTFLALA